MKNTDEPNAPRRPTRPTRRLVTAGLTATLVAGALAFGGGSASAAGRVDLEKPTFSDPTSITNPLFESATPRKK